MSEDSRMSSIVDINTSGARALPVQTGICGKEINHELNANPKDTPTRLQYQSRGTPSEILKTIDSKSVENSLNTTPNKANVDRRVGKSKMALAITKECSVKLVKTTGNTEIRHVPELHDLSSESDVSGFINNVKESAFSIAARGKRISVKENLTNFQNALDSSTNSDLSSINVSETLETSRKATTNKVSFISKPRHQSGRLNVSHGCGNQKRISSKAIADFQKALESTDTSTDTDDDLSLDKIKVNAFCRLSQNAKKSRWESNFQAALDSTTHSDVSDVTFPIQSAFCNLGKTRRHNINNDAFKKALESSVDTSVVITQLSQNDASGSDDVSCNKGSHREEMSPNAVTCDEKNNPMNTCRDENREDLNLNDLKTRQEKECNSTNSNLNNDNETPSSGKYVGCLIFGELQSNANPDEIRISVTEASLTERNVPLEDQSSSSATNVTRLNSTLDDDIIRDKSVSQNDLVSMVNTTMHNSDLASKTNFHISNEVENSSNNMSLSARNILNVDKSLTQPSAILDLESDYDSMMLSSDSLDETDTDEEQCDETENQPSNGNCNRNVSLVRDNGAPTMDKSDASSVSVTIPERIAQLNNNYDSMEMTTDSILVENSNKSKTVVNTSCNNVITSNTGEPAQKRKRLFRKCTSNSIMNEELEAAGRNEEIETRTTPLTSSSQPIQASTSNSRGANSSENDDSLRRQALRSSTRLVEQEALLRKRNSKDSYNKSTVSFENGEPLRISLLGNPNSTSSAEISHSANGSLSLIASCGDDKSFDRPETQKQPKKKLRKNAGKNSKELDLSELRNERKKDKNVLGDCEKIHKMLSFPEKTKSSMNEINTQNNDNNEDDDSVIKVKKQPTLKKPKRWITSRLYKFIIDKLEPKYGLNSNRRAEKFVIHLCNTYNTVTKLSVKEEYKKQVDLLMIEMAKLQLVDTYFDFYNFVQCYMPYKFQLKSVPTLMPFNQEPLVDSMSLGESLTRIL